MLLHVPRLARTCRSTSFRIHRIYQAERFLVRQERLLHLVHYVSEPDPIFRIGESVASACAGMTERIRCWAENFPARTGRIFHQPSGKRGRDFKNAIESVSDDRRHQFDGIAVEKFSAVDLAAVGQHCVKLCQGGGAADPTKGNKLARTVLWSVHRADGI